MERARGAPRLYHRKSRLGCQRCKARRVKCDEGKPQCGGCKRHGVTCVYAPSQGGSLSPGSQGLVSTSPSEISERGSSSITDEQVFDRDPAGQRHSTAAESDVVDIPETASERLLQLRLFHHHVYNLTNLFPTQHPENLRIWQNDVPVMALKHDNLLYALFSYAATNLIRSNPDDAELVAARQRYLAVALGEQRKAVVELSIDNADAMCFAALLIHSTHFAMLHERKHEPYMAPMEWLRMGRGAGETMQLALRTAREDTNSKIMTVLTATKPAMPNLSVDSDFHEDLFPPFSNLLDIYGQDLDPNTRRIYEITIMYLAGLQHDIDEGKPPLFLSRKIMGFSMLIPKEFDDFVQQEEPLALVVLAYFFAIVAQMKGAPWWVGNAPNTEILALEKALPAEWHECMRWPVGIITG